MTVLPKLLLFLMIGPASAGDSLTPDGLRAWLSAGGFFESNAKLVHDQMEQQRSGLPPWWPTDVYSEEEAAIAKVDFVDAAVPFYEACLTDPQARLLAKIATSSAGQKVSSAALKAHSNAALNGDELAGAQSAGEDAADKTAKAVSEEERRSMAAMLTPQEKALAAKTFTPEKAAILRQCTNKALAQTAVVMKARQQAAAQAVIEVHRMELATAQANWFKEHPEKSP
ncbi:hypothetical protein [Granulicella aggregans]|uniref:hypothetical protein n=1 Tax=Granulicella aggregans TaxID=474949 RepID=UPI0021E0E690|nr:hypothetical protein [Granulicella aggregans]